MLVQLAAFAFLLPAAVTPAVAAPADVTVAWSSDTHRDVLVTWQEDGDYADHVWVTDLGGAPAGYHQQVAAGQPDQLVISTADLPPDRDLRLAVQPVDASGQPLGDAAHSVGFDTDRPPAPVVTGATPREDGTVLLTWRPGDYHDDTPGDPLDLPAVRSGYGILGSQPTFADWDSLGSAPASATSFVVPARTLPESLLVEGGFNEWSTAPSTSNAVDIYRTQLTASIPHTATTGRRLRVTGVSTLVIRFCDPGPCGTMQRPDSGRVVRLQARTGSAAPWRTVATTSAAGGRYSFQITSPGPRQYRVVAEPTSGSSRDNPAKSYAATAAVAVGSSGSGSSEAGGGLPITGAPAAWVAAGGVILLLLGAALAFAGRRRRRAGA